MPAAASWVPSLCASGPLTSRCRGRTKGCMHLARLLQVARMHWFTGLCPRFLYLAHEQQAHPGQKLTEPSATRGYEILLPGSTVAAAGLPESAGMRHPPWPPARWNPSQLRLADGSGFPRRAPATRLEPGSQDHSSALGLSWLHNTHHPPGLCLHLPGSGGRQSGAHQGRTAQAGGSKTPLGTIPRLLVPCELIKSKELNSHPASTQAVFKNAHTDSHTHSVCVPEQTMWVIVEIEKC